MKVSLAYIESSRSLNYSVKKKKKEKKKPSLCAPKMRAGTGLHRHHHPPSLTAVLWPSFFWGLETHACLKAVTSHYLESQGLPGNVCALDASLCAGDSHSKQLQTEWLKTECFLWESAGMLSL